MGHYWVFDEAEAIVSPVGTVLTVWWDGAPHPMILVENGEWLEFKDEEGRRLRWLVDR